MRRALGLSWWPFRSSFRVRRGGYLAIVLLSPGPDEHEILK